MKKRSLLVFASFYCLISVFSVSAQQAFIAPLAQHSLLLDITELNTHKLVAVGERGHIITSIDGEEWQQANVPTTSTLTAVTFIGQAGWAVGHDSIILHSLDGGVTWTVQQFLPDTERPLMDVHFTDSTHGIAIGAYGSFYRTQDGGETWRKELHSEFLSQDDQDYLEDLKQEDEAFYQEELASILPHLNRIFADGDTLYIAGEVGLVAISTDGGYSWERQEVDYIGSFFALNKLETGEMVVAGLRGNIYKQDVDNGKWVNLPSELNTSINSLVAVEGGKLIALANNGEIGVLADGNINVNKIQSGDDLIGGIQMGKQLVVVSETGIMLIPTELAR